MLIRPTLLLLVVVVVRSAGRFLDPGLWAEDGLIFFGQPILLDASILAFKPYAGYLHVAPRLVAAVSGLLPAAWIPLAYLLFETAIKAVCLAELARPCYRGLIPDDRLRLAACLTAAAVLDHLGEPGICNLHWFLMLWLSLALARPVESHAEGLRVGMAGLLCALSSAQSVVLLPLCVWMLRRPWTVRSVVPLCAAVGGVVQLAVAASTFQFEASGDALAPATLARALPISLAARAILPVVAGTGWVMRLAPVAPLAVGLSAIAATAGFVAVVVWLWRRDRSLQPTILGCLYLIVASAAAVLVGRGVGADFSDFRAFGIGVYQRYFILASALVLFLLFAAADRWMAATRKYLIALLFLPACIGNSVDQPELGGYYWRRQAAEIDRYREARRAGQPVTGLSVAVHPLGWAVILPSTRPPSAWPAYPPPADPAWKSRRRQPSPERIGRFRAGLFVLDTNGDGRLVAPPDAAFQLAGSTDIALAGDWTGTGVTRAGIFRPLGKSRGGIFFLDTDGDHRLSRNDTGCDLRINEPLQGIPVVGDWNGDGRSKPGIFHEGKWWLDVNGDCVFDRDGDAAIEFGMPGDRPVVGDWDGDGRANPGVVRQGFLWVLDMDGDGKLARVNEPGGDVSFPFGGLPGDVPVAGDWRGTGKTYPGLLRSGNVLMLDSNENYRLDVEGENRDTVLPIDMQAGDSLVVGRW